MGEMQKANFQILCDFIKLSVNPKLCCENLDSGLSVDLYHPQCCLLRFTIRSENLKKPKRLFAFSMCIIQACCYVKS